MLKRFLPVLALASALATTALAGVTMTPNVKAGDVVSGEFAFKVTVQSDSLVTSVEFYVGGDLRDTDESTPYEFNVDTLNETQGDMEVTFAAYTKSGESAKKTIKVKIDNGLDKGIDAQIDKGNAALADSKWDDAIWAARVALKIAPTDNRARIVMARANLGKGVLDLAERYADDAVASDPNNPMALNLLSTVNLRKAFSTYSRSGDKAETVGAIKDSMVKAALLRRKVLEMAVDNFGTVTDSNRLAFCDVLMDAGRYSRIISELDPVFRSDMKNNDVANRLIYAELRAGRFSMANQALENIRKYGESDGYGYALRSCFNAYFGNTREALDAEKEAILADPTSLGVKTAQAYLALRRADTKTAANIMTTLGNLEGQSPVVNYGVCALAFLTSDFDVSRDRFQTALLAEPASYDILVERANQSVWFSLRTDIENDTDYPKRQRKLAQAFFETALEARNESFEALTGLCCVAMLDGRKEDAVKMGRAAVAAGPEYAAAQWAYCAALFDAGRNDDAKAAAKKAQSLDSKNLGGLPYPVARAAWEYFFGKSRIPYLLPVGK